MRSFKLHHGLDLSVDAGPPLPLFGRRNPSTRLKALCKKSITIACRPILDSSAVMRTSVFSCLLSSLHPGRPIGRNPTTLLAVGVAPAIQQTPLYLQFAAQA